MFESRNCTSSSLNYGSLEVFNYLKSMGDIVLLKQNENNEDFK